MNKQVVRYSIVIFYLLIALEFFYMASPFAIYFYSVYGPGLRFLNANPVMAWLSSFFLPHIVFETSSLWLNLRDVFGAALAIIGFLAFCVGAGQVYYHKLSKKGAVTGGIYNHIRHPQYLSLGICSFGLLLLWPRYIALIMFVAVLFAYCFLAKAEERECERKFGSSYIQYKTRTNMFLPFGLPLTDKLPELPKSGLKRYMAILALYLVTVTASVGLANGLNSWSLDSLYALYSKDAAYLSSNKLDEDTLAKIVEIALADEEIQIMLENAKRGTNTRFINYVLPAEWYVSEIPMNVVEGATGHYSPADYERNLYKVIFTRAHLRTDQQVEGKEIILNTAKRTPVVEVWVDLSQYTVIDKKDPPETVMYESIPVPLY